MTVLRPIDQASRRRVFWKDDPEKFDFPLDELVVRNESGEGQKLCGDADGEGDRERGPGGAPRGKNGFDVGALRFLVLRAGRGSWNRSFCRSPDCDLIADDEGNLLVFVKSRREREACVFSG